MSKRPSPTVTQIKTIARLRAAGFPLAVIATRTRLSVATVQRYCARLGIRKADFKSVILEQAKRELLEDAAFVKAVKNDVRLLVLDGVSQAKTLRDKISLTLENIESTDLESAATAARAIAALSTALKISGDTLSQIKLESVGAEDLPKLTVSVLTPEQIGEAIRKNHGGNLELVGEDDEDFEGDDG